jgi:hypothetical protein
VSVRGFGFCFKYKFWGTGSRANWERKSPSFTSDDRNTSSFWNVTTGPWAYQLQRIATEHSYVYLVFVLQISMGLKKNLKCWRGRGKNRDARNILDDTRVCCKLIKTILLAEQLLTEHGYTAVLSELPVQLFRVPRDGNRVNFVSAVLKFTAL